MGLGLGAFVGGGGRQRSRRPDLASMVTAGGSAVRNALEAAGQISLPLLDQAADAVGPALERAGHLIHQVPMPLSGDNAA